MRKTIVISVCVLFVALAGIFILYGRWFPKDTENHVMSTIKNEFNGDVEKWCESLIGKRVSEENGELKIDNERTNLKVENFQKEDGDERVISFSADDNNQIVLKLSNNNYVTLKHKGLSLNKKQYTVKFFSSNETLLKTEKVREGKDASPPEPPKKDGYHFLKWDKSFNHVKKDLAIYAQYEKNKSEPEIFVRNKTISGKKDEVWVNIEVSNNPGILGMTLQIKYDEKSLVLKDARVGDVVKDYLTLTKDRKLNSCCKFLFDGVALPEKISKKGVILKLKFKINQIDKFDKALIEIKAEEGDVVNGRLLPIYPLLRNGYIIKK